MRPNKELKFQVGLSQLPLNKLRIKSPDFNNIRHTVSTTGFDRHNFLKKGSSYLNNVLPSF